MLSTGARQMIDSFREKGFGLFASAASKGNPMPFREVVVVYMDSKPFLVARFRDAVMPVLWQVSLDCDHALTVVVEPAGPEHALVLRTMAEGELARARFATVEAAWAAHASVSSALMRAGRRGPSSASGRSRTGNVLMIATVVLLLIAVLTPSHRKNKTAEAVKTSEAAKPSPKAEAGKAESKGGIAFIPESELPDTMKGATVIQRITPQPGEPAPADNVLPMLPND